MTCCDGSLEKSISPEWHEGIREEDAGVRAFLPGVARATRAMMSQISEIVSMAEGNEFLNAWGALLGIDWAPYRGELINAWVPAAEKVIRMSMSRTAIGIGSMEKITPGDINRFAREEAEKNALTMAETTTLGSQLGLKHEIQDAVANNLSALEMSRRSLWMVGNNTRDSEFIARQSSRMLSTGVPKANVEKWARKESKRKRKARAEMIARTEINTARNAGTQRALEEAINSGHLPIDIKKEWIMNQGCKICTAIVMQGSIPLRSNWSHPLGGSISHPPAHPNCRCSHGIVSP